MRVIPAPRAGFWLPDSGFNGAQSARFHRIDMRLFGSKCHASGWSPCNRGNRWAGIFPVL